MRLLMFPAAWALGLSLVLGCGRDAPDGVALVGATVIDGSGGPALPDAVTALTSTPARTIGRPELGSLAVGAVADAVLLDAGLQVRRVFTGTV